MESRARTKYLESNKKKPEIEKCSTVLDFIQMGDGWTDRLFQNDLTTVLLLLLLSSLMLNLFDSADMVVCGRCGLFGHFCACEFWKFNKTFNVMV